MFEGFELNNDVAAAVFFTAATLSTFKNGLGKISSSVKAYSGEGWLLSTGISSGLVTAAAAARLELLPMVLNAGVETLSPDHAHWKETCHCHRYY